MAKKNEKQYVTLKEYNEFREYVHNYNWSTYDEVRALEKKADEMYGRIMPEEGMGCTVILFSDTRAATVTRVITPDKIAIRENNAHCEDFYGDRWTVLDELVGVEQIYTRRKSGCWVEMGQPDKYGSVRLGLGYRHHSIDPSF